MDPAGRTVAPHSLVLALVSHLLTRTIFARTIGKRLEAQGLGSPTSGGGPRMKEYSTPQIRPLGSVTDLTQTGLTHPGNDTKEGSRPSQGV